MTEIDFSKIAELVSKPEVQKTAFSVGDILKNMGEIEKVILTLDKFVKVIETSPSLSTLIRIAAKTNNIEIAALRTDSPITVDSGIMPSSNSHKEFFAALNQLPESEIQKLLKMKNGQQEKP